MQVKRAAIIACVCAAYFLGHACPAATAGSPAAPPGQDSYGKAQAASEKGDWDAALRHCDDALKLNRRLKEAWLLKGQVYWQMKNHKMAVSSFDECLRIDPRNVTVWVNRGANLFEMKRYKEMQDSYDKARTLDPRSPLLYKTMGIDCFLMGDFDGSYKAFQKLQELGEASTYLALNKRMLQIIDPGMAPPASWSINLDSYQTVLELDDPSKAGCLVNLTSLEGTAIRFQGSADEPFKYAPNFEVWEGAMIFDRRGAGLLANGTRYRYRKISGDTLTIEEGKIHAWRMVMSAKKCFLLNP
jgi:hypothetical protein